MNPELFNKLTDAVKQMKAIRNVQRAVNDRKHGDIVYAPNVKYLQSFMKNQLTFEYWKSKKLYFWHLKSRNGKIVCAGEPNGYERLGGIKSAMGILARNGLKFTAKLKA